MSDRLTLSAAESARLLPLANPAATVPQIEKNRLRASMQQAMDALTDGGSHYSLDSLADRQTVIDQKRRDSLLAELESEEDPFADDRSIDLEVAAGAHLDELQDVLTHYESGELRMSQETVDDMVAIMTELRQIMPELPDHIIDEIKTVARPLRKAVADFEESIEIV